MRMTLRDGALFAAFACLVALPSTSRAIQLECVGNYKSVAVGEVGEFFSTIRGVGPGVDSIDVSIEYFVPETWFAQFCQVSTGICYFGDARIAVPTVGPPDTLRIDLFTDFFEPGMGWVRITAADANDPTDRAVCSYTVFSGQPVQIPNLALTCGDNTVQAAPGAVVEFFTPLKNLSATDDNPYVILETDMPVTWFGQFCQTSTGICYFDDTEIDVTPSQQDTLRVDFFTGAGNADGLIALEVHSGRNPSFYDLCLYRVFTGPHSADAPELTPRSDVHAWSQPNPFGEVTDIRFAVPAAGRVELQIYGADGRLVRAFEPVEVSPGAHGFEWDGRDAHGQRVAAGAYFYRLSHSAGSAKGVVVRLH